MAKGRDERLKQMREYSRERYAALRNDPERSRQRNEKMRESKSDERRAYDRERKRQQREARRAQQPSSPATPQPLTPEQQRSRERGRFLARVRYGRRTGALPADYVPSEEEIAAAIREALEDAEDLDDEAEEFEEEAEDAGNVDLVNQIDIVRMELEERAAELRRMGAIQPPRDPEQRRAFIRELNTRRQQLEAERAKLQELAADAADYHHRNDQGGRGPRF